MFSPDLPPHIDTDLQEVSRTYMQRRDKTRSSCLLNCNVSSLRNLNCSVQTNVHFQTSCRSFFFFSRLGLEGLWPELVSNMTALRPCQAFILEDFKNFDLTELDSFTSTRGLLFSVVIHIHNMLSVKLNPPRGRSQLFNPRLSTPRLKKWLMEGLSAS